LKISINSKNEILLKLTVKFHLRESRACLVLVSRDRSPDSFHELQKCKNNIASKLQKKKMFEQFQKPNEDYVVEDIGIADLKHFIYIR
jgi:hypothetical protein